MEMPAEQFKSLQEEDARARREAKRGTTATSRRKTAGIVEALDLPEGSVVTRPNSYISVSYLRDLFRCFPWLDLRGIAVMSNLLHSKVLCKLCYLETAGSGVFDCNKATLEEHATSKLHQDKIAKSHKRQLDLLQAGAVHASVSAQQVAARQLVVGHLVTGTDGFAGIPYSRITEAGDGLLDRGREDLARARRAGSAVVGKAHLFCRRGAHLFHPHPHGRRAPPPDAGRDTIQHAFFACEPKVEQLVAERAAAERGFPGVGDAGAASRDAAAQVAGAAAAFSALGAPAGAACAKRGRLAARDDPVALAAAGPSAAGAGLPPAAKRADAADSSAVI